MILPIRDLAASPHCSACEQLKAVERSSTQWPLVVLALLDDFRKWPDQVPWYGSSGRADSPCSGRTDSILDSEFSGSGIWIRLEIIAAVIPDRYLSQRYNFGHGSFSESLSSLTPCKPRRSVSGSPLTESDWLSLKGVTHTDSTTIMFQATVN